MYSLLFYFMIVSFIQLQIIESKTCANFETDVDFNEDDITPIPTNGNLDCLFLFFVRFFTRKILIDKNFLNSLCYILCFIT